ncbi:hypothetical protein [Serratia rhizosphaerae]|uniref:hypothetical protein n=1 Tax=Serratia rhizosphaerae TaxID=2597702 RepID=UPI002DBF5E52|nr:hypothetical protein [Serratia rhizosphaerae]MEB6335714.1 hypothetical protein [Serratia rhizosphaerae]
MKKIIFIITVIFVPYTYANDCSVNEILIASCDLSGEVNRKATFCANEKNDTIKYTFSKGVSSELIVNFNSKEKLKRWVDMGTYTTYLGFNRGKYSYVLSIPEERLNVVAQLDVKKDGELISTKQCDSNSFGEKILK